MIKKIQKYLLLNQPIVWNIRLIPMLLLLLGMHLLIFGIGYATTNTTFGKSHYSYSPTNSLGMVYFVCLLVSTLLLIGWLVFYSRNNGFKTFYPRKTSQLYMEWLMIILITTGLTLTPLTLTMGYVSKWKAVASLKEAQEAVDVLSKVEVLIPSSINSYTYSQSLDKPIPIPSTLNLKPDKLDLDLYSTEYNRNQGVIIKGYTGHSLLFYKTNEYDYSTFYEMKSNLSEADRRKIENQELVKKWLRTEKKDSIYAVIQNFENLLTKHDFKSNLSSKKWMEIVYNPPFFPVYENITIGNWEPSYYGEDNYEAAVLDSDTLIVAEAVATSAKYDSPASPTLRYFVQHEELSVGYNNVLRYHEYDEWQTIALLCCCFSLGLAILVYSFRATAGKPWLIALIASGILIFTSILLDIGIVDSLVDNYSDRLMVLFFGLFWIAIFIALLIKILFKISNNSSKGRSSVYLNIFIWLIPCIIPLLFFSLGTYYELSHIGFFRIRDEHILTMFWYNIAATVIAMLPVSILVRKWKSLPED